jgi:hypothetical protein
MDDQPAFVPQTSHDLAADGTKLDPERLRNITATLSAPYLGLGAAAFGAAFAAFQMLDVYWHGSHWMGLPVLLLASPFAVWFFYLRKYYASRFGWVQPRQPSAISTKEIGILGGFGGVLLVIWVVANVLQSLVHLPVDLPFLTLMQSVAFLVLFVFLASWSHPRPIFAARFTIWAALVAVQGVISVLPVWVQLSPDQWLFWKLLNAGSLGILIVAMGLCNHVAMLRMLPKRVEDDDHD